MRIEPIAASIVFLSLACSGTPVERALEQVGEAINERNQLRLERLVEIDSLATQIVQSYADDTSDRWNELRSKDRDLSDIAEATPRELQVASMVDSTFHAVMQGSVPEDARSLATRVREGIQDGTLDEVLSSGNFGASTARPSLFEGISDIEVDGNLAIAGLLFHHPDADTTLTLRVRLERQDGDWRVVRFSNWESYFRAAFALSPSDEEVSE